MIHRILSGLVRGEEPSELQKQFGRFAPKAAAQSSATELTAHADRAGLRGLLQGRVHEGSDRESYDGIISSVTSFGMYVELPNTVEGLVRIEDLPDGEYFYDGVMELTDIHSGRRYRMGDRVRVRCVDANVNEGHVDFLLEEGEGWR